MPQLDKQDLESTHERIQGYIHRTPVMSSTLVNEKANCELFFKCENFQKMGAFKMRGATNAILQLSDEDRAKGVVTHSSGNFAQAVALSGNLLGVKTYIVMPANSPEVKKRAVADYGGEIIICENSVVSRESTAEEVRQRTGATFLHPYDQNPVIAGQGTACKELLEDVGDLDCVIAPVGGGGLLSGTALAAKYFGGGIPVYSAEPMGADDAYLSIQKGEIVPQTNPQTIADGLRTSLGQLTFPIIRDEVKEIFLVSEEEIVEAMQLVWERMKIIIEPSSAVAVAAVIKNPDTFAGKRVGLIVSGGNVDVAALPFG